MIKLIFADESRGLPPHLEGQSLPILPNKPRYLHPSPHLDSFTLPLLVRNVRVDQSFHPHHPPSLQLAAPHVLITPPPDPPYLDIP